jgi:hypothetical protein
MFWIFIVFVILATILVKIGAYSVWVSMLSLLLKIACTVIVLLSVGLLWKKIIAKRKS